MSSRSSSRLSGGGRSSQRVAMNEGNSKNNRDDDDEEEESDKEEAPQRARTKRGNQVVLEEEVTDSTCPFKRHAANAAHLDAQLTLAMSHYYGEDKAKCDQKYGSQLDKFNSTYSEDIRNSMVRTVVRLFLTKGAQKKSVDRSHIADELKKLDTRQGSDYPKHFDVILHKAKTDLYDIFGYIVVPCDKLLGVPTKNGSKDAYILKNGLKVDILKGQNHAKYHKPSEADFAYKGFVFAVCHAVFSSVEREITERNLRIVLNKIDPGISRDVNLKNTRKSSNSNSSSNSANNDDDGDDNGAAGDNYNNNNSDNARKMVPGLFADAEDLIKRMQDEQYIVRFKDAPRDGSAVDNALVEYKLRLGPRFYANIGLSNTLQSHFDARNEVVPKAIKKAFDDDMRSFLDALPEHVRTPLNRKLLPNAEEDEEDEDDE